MFASLIFVATLLSLSATAASSSLPWPKQIVAVRRRSGLSHKEFLYYHTLVHGAKCWNAPRDNSFPATYVQSWVFDSAFGVNDTVPDYSYHGRDDVTELYSSTATTFLGEPDSYIQTVIGPDGANFNDLASAFSMTAYETFPFQVPETPCSANESCDQVKAFMWVSSTDQSVDNTTFGTNLGKALLTLLPTGTVSNASLHVNVPDTDSRLYYGGYNLPTMNAVIKLWLHDTDTAVDAIRKAQTQLDASKLGYNADVSFIVFAKAVTIYDTTKNIPFDAARLTQSLKSHTQY